MKIARLEVVLFRREKADEAVLRCVRLLQAMGPERVDREALHRLAAQLSTFGRKKVMSAVGALLEELAR